MKLNTLSSNRVFNGAEAIRKRRLWASTALFACSFVAFAGPGRAQEIIDGSMETVDINGFGTKPSPWLLPGSLILGDQNAGMLIVQNGGLASASAVQLGELLALDVQVERAHLLLRRLLQELLEEGIRSFSGRRSQERGRH